MGYIDIALVVILGLALIFGLIKGFSSKHITWPMLLLSGLAGYFIGVPIGKALLNSAVGYDWLTSLYLKTIPESSIFNAPLVSDVSQRTIQLQNGLTEMGFPTFFQSLFVSNAVNLSSDVGTAIASSFSALTLFGIGFLLIFVLAFVLLRLILRPIWKTCFGEEGKNFLGRIFGGVFRVAKSTLWLLLVFVVLVLINDTMLRFGNTVIDDFLINDLGLVEQNAFPIGKLFYNTADMLVGWIIR